MRFITRAMVLIFTCTLPLEAHAQNSILLVEIGGYHSCSDGMDGQTLAPEFYRLVNLLRRNYPHLHVSYLIACAPGIAVAKDGNPLVYRGPNGIGTVSARPPC